MPFNFKLLEQFHFEMLHISKFALPATFGKNVVFPWSWRGRLGLLAAEHFNIFKVEMLYNLNVNLLLSISKLKGSTVFLHFSQGRGQAQRRAARAEQRRERANSFPASWEMNLEQIHFEMLHISKFSLPATFEKNVVFPRSCRGRLGLLAAEHFNIFKVEIALGE